MTRMPDEGALDKLLRDIHGEVSGQLNSLQDLKVRVAKLVGQPAESRASRLRARADNLLEHGYDDGSGEAINPDIEEGLSWLDNEGVPNLEDEANDLANLLDEQIESRQRRLGELEQVIANLPPNSFFNNREESEEEE